MNLCALETARPTVVTLKTAAGDPYARWTLQGEEREGRIFRWAPEGQLRQLGSGEGHRRRWIHRGWRRELVIRWGGALESRREAWASGAWGAAEILTTAEAAAEIHNAAQVEVEPLSGSEFGSYLAQTFEHELPLRDLKGVVHTKVELVLRALDLVEEIRFVQPSGLSGWGWTAWGLGPWGS